MGFKKKKKKKITCLPAALISVLMLVDGSNSLQFLNHLTGSIAVLSFAFIVKSILRKENKLASESYPQW